MATPEKQAAVAELVDGFRESDAAVLTEYRGLSVGQLAELRRSLGDTTSYQVVKNTLTRLAATEAGVAAFDGLLDGPNAVAFVKGDPVEATKSLRDFARTNPQLVLKAGWVDGQTLDADELRRLADLESREALLSSLAGAMKASLSGAASLFQAPLGQAARMTEALRAKVEQEGGAGAAVEAADTDQPSGADQPAEGTTTES
ncbi:MAG: 50S ribosomal protein L10 [Streptosporangiales bacterium]